MMAFMTSSLCSVRNMCCGEGGRGGGREGGREREGKEMELGEGGREGEQGGRKGKREYQLEI